jgi:hypothetical protein
MGTKGYAMLRSIQEAKLLPLALAVTMGLGAGWWARGGPVHAKDSSSSAYAPTQFQMSSGSRDGSVLSIYYPDQRMLYTYPMQAGSANIACINGFKIGAEGQPIERQNCAPGKPY